MKKSIAITGANGIIGKVLTEGLQDYPIKKIVRPETDSRDYRQVLNAIKGCSAVVHLAWDTKIDNFTTGKINPHNSTMFYNVFQAALDAKVPRVIMASSVHADKFYGWRGPEDLLTPGRTPIPDSPYGAHKVYMEAMGRYYASKGLEVVCIRFGGVNPESQIPIDPPEERAVWFSHRDCVSLVKTVIDADTVPDNFYIVYGVSDNKNRMHDITNPWGWRPKDSADNY